MRKRFPQDVTQLLLEENASLESDRSEPPLAADIIPAQRRSSHSRLPGRVHYRRSRLPGRCGNIPQGRSVPHRHLSRSISREEIQFRSESREEDVGRRRLGVDILPIAGFPPHSRSCSETTSNNSVMAPTTSMIAFNGDNSFAYGAHPENSISHTPTNSIDSFRSLPDIPEQRVNHGYVPQLSTILSPSASMLATPSMSFKYSDTSTTESFSYIQIRENELQHFADQLSETEVDEPVEFNPNQSRIQLLGVTEFRPLAGHVSLQTVHERTTSYSTTSEELPPLPVETDEEDFGLENASLRVADSYASTNTDSDMLPDPPAPTISPSPQFMPIHFEENKRMPQISLLRANIDPPLIEKRIPHTPEPLLIDPPESFPMQQHSSLEPGSMRRKPNAIDVVGEDAYSTPEPDLVLSQVPHESWSAERFQNEGHVEGASRGEGAVGVSVTVSDLKIPERRDSGEMSPSLLSGLSPNSQSSRRTSSANEGCEAETADGPDIVISPIVQEKGYRGSLHVYIEDAWSPVFGIIRNEALDIRIVEQGMRLFGSVSFHLVNSVQKESARKDGKFFPFTICLKPRVSIGFIDQNLELQSPRGEAGSSDKQQVLRFSAGSCALRDQWISQINTYLPQNEEIPLPKVPDKDSLWPPEMFTLMEACFSQFENSARLNDFVHICEVCQLSAQVDVKELFEALDVQDQGFVLWRKVKKILAEISNQTDLDLLTSKSKQQKLYKKHQRKAVVLRGLNPEIRDSEDWLCKILDILATDGAVKYEIVRENVEFLFREQVGGEAHMNDMKDRIKRVLIGSDVAQNPESLHVALLNMEEFLENFSHNRQFFEGIVPPCFE